MGRPSSRLRVLALAVTVLLLIDPLLVHSVGFLLSVGACVGIAVLARPLTDLLPGPRGLITPLAVTMAAQVGVAPVLVPVFGGVPVASLPANLLAVPAAGPVMMWGLAAGLPAGVLGGTVAPRAPRRRLCGSRGAGARPPGRRRLLGPAVAPRSAAVAGVARLRTRR